MLMVINDVMCDYKSTGGGGRRGSIAINKNLSEGNEMPNHSRCKRPTSDEERKGWPDPAIVR